MQATNTTLAAQIEHSEEVVEELPDDRQYERDAHQQLDEALSTAIEAAENVDNSMLVCVLRFELAGHHLKHSNSKETKDLQAEEVRR